VLPSENILRKYYEGQYSAQHNQLEIQESQREYYRCHLAELSEFYGKHKERLTLADYGCSYPIFLLEARSDFSTIGIEPDIEACKFGIQNDIDMYMPEEFFTKVAENSINILRFSHVLEHCISPSEILKRCTEKVKKGGILYISQPNFPVFRYDSGKELRDSVYPEHLHFFSPISLTMMVKNCGYKLIRFFTHTEADATLREERNRIDIHKSCCEMAGLLDAGDFFFGGSANYPYYAGENSYLIARKV
jgi:hypothetical protein